MQRGRAQGSGYVYYQGYAESGFYIVMQVVKTYLNPSDPSQTGDGHDPSGYAEGGFAANAQVFGVVNPTTFSLVSPGIATRAGYNPGGASRPPSWMVPPTPSCSPRNTGAVQHVNRDGCPGGPLERHLLGLGRLLPEGPRWGGVLSGLPLVRFRLLRNSFRSRWPRFAVPKHAAALVNFGLHSLSRSSSAPEASLPCWGTPACVWSAPASAPPPGGRPALQPTATCLAATAGKLKTHSLSCTCTRCSSARRWAALPRGRYGGMRDAFVPWVGYRPTTALLLLLAAVGGLGSANVSGPVTYKDEPLTTGAVIIYGSELGTVRQARSPMDTMRFPALVGDVKIAVTTPSTPTPQAPRKIKKGKQKEKEGASPDRGRSPAAARQGRPHSRALQASGKIGVELHSEIRRKPSTSI